MIVIFSKFNKYVKNAKESGFDNENNWEEFHDGRQHLLNPCNACDTNSQSDLAQEKEDIILYWINYMKKLFAVTIMLLHLTLITLIFFPR
jgi:hypothetical protein